MLGILTISVLIILLIIIIYLCIPKWFPKTYETFTSRNNFLSIADSILYQKTDVKENPVNIKYQIPIAQNQLTDTQLQLLDTDILRNVRSLVNFSLTDELTFYQMYNLLKQIRGQSYNFKYDPNKIKKKSRIKDSEKIIELNTGSINNTDLELFYRLKLELISILNNKVIKNGYYLPYHQYQFFKIINSNLINQTKGSTIDNYIFTTTVAREFKYQQFVLYWDIDLSKGTNIEYTARINKLELIGVPIPKSIEFHDERKTTDVDINIDGDDIFKVIKNKEEQDKSNSTKIDIYREQVSDSQEFNIQPAGNGKVFQSPETKFIDITERSDMDPVLFDDNSQNAMVENKIMNMARDKKFRNHRCYGLVNGINKELQEYNDNPIFCKSFHPEISQNGIWDAPCQVNTDCPFYQANKNYPNEFGKCNKETGQCEMPMGVIPIGFTKYGKIEPQCYNCGMNSIDNRCCGEQAYNIIKGSASYKSPDYIFKNDNLIRKQFNTQLEENGLKSNPSI
jgi:hypothetical protein